jgi:hypothetical protein
MGVVFPAEARARLGGGGSAGAGGSRGRRLEDDTPVKLTMAGPKQQKRQGEGCRTQKVAMFTRSGG